MEDINYAIKMNDISKYFGKIKANENITLKVEKGSIHALIGENGAGKSTLMSLLFGLYEPTKGHIKVNGKRFSIKDPTVANSLGIGMVHQHFKLVDIYTSLENIMLGSETTVGPQLLNKKRAKKRIKALQEKYDMNFNLSKKVSKSSVGEQQKIEIMKMLYKDSDILVFDEPTAVLTPQEIQGLLSAMENFKKLGKTIIFITHKLNEVMQVCDRATVIRKGKSIGTVDIANTSINKLSEMMVGSKIVKSKHKPGALSDEPAIRLENIFVRKTSHNKALEDISFDIKKGEIVAIAGVEGNGQSEIAEVISGMIKPQKGKIFINEQNISKKSIKKRYGTFNKETSKYENGISHIPEDRLKYAGVLNFSVSNNMILQNINQKPFSKSGLIKKSEIKKYAFNIIDSFDVRGTNDGESKFRSLSGGNQQKAIVGREMTREHELLVAAQPTRGLDIGAINYIHSRILEEKQKNKAILLISFELDEVLELADRIIVVSEGKIMGIKNVGEITKPELGLLMAGIKKG